MVCIPRRPDLEQLKCDLLAAHSGFLSNDDRVTPEEHLAGEPVFFLIKEHKVPTSALKQCL
jgi:hypothetical protein